MGKKSILVMFGGKSPEHEVSVITGLQVFQKISQHIMRVKVINSHFLCGPHMFMIMQELDKKKK